MGQQCALVVDDDPIFRAILRGLFVAEGFEVYEACNGYEALATPIMWDVQAIVLDIVMPQMCGLETLRKLRANPRFAETPIVVITGHTTLRSLITQEYGDTVPLLTKPLNLDDALTVIRGLLRVSQARGTGRRPRSHH